MATPAVVAFPECRVVARWTDGFLMIVAAHRTPGKLLAEARNVLDPSKLIGVVLNGDDRRLRSHYGCYQYYAADARDGHASWWGRARHASERRGPIPPG